jgi:hypothetical protein
MKTVWVVVAVLLLLAWLIVGLGIHTACIDEVYFAPPDAPHYTGDNSHA